MRARWSGWIASLSIAVAGCAGDGDGTPNETDDGVCRIVWREDGSEVEVGMSDDRRFVTVGDPATEPTYHFDENQRLTSQVFPRIDGLPLRAPREYMYDAQGHLVSAITFGEPGVVQCVNDYDDQDRLISHQCTDAHHSYRYDDEGRIDQFTTNAPGDTPRVYSVGYDNNDRITSFEDAISLYTYAYDSNGRMTSRERDWTYGGTKDGTPDIRWTWNRDAGGNVRTYDQDGTDHNDAPVIDGVADLRWTFSPSCDPIGALHPWIYNEPQIINVGHPQPGFPF